MAAATAGREFAFVGGHVVLDLLNTVRWRLDPGQRADSLETYEDLLAWARQAGLISPEEHRTLHDQAEAEPDRAESELGAARDLRDASYGALLVHDPDAVADLERLHRDARERVRLAEIGSGWAWREAETILSTPRDRLARAAVDLLTSQHASAVHQCEDQACGWVYLDTSPRRNRRWCVAADCGNRNRARRFYARHRARSSSSGAD